MINFPDVLPYVPIHLKIDALLDSRPFVRCPTCRLPLQRHEGGGLYCGNQACKTPHLLFAPATKEQWGRKHTERVATEAEIKEQESHFKTTGQCKHLLRAAELANGAFLCTICGRTKWPYW